MNSLDIYKLLPKKNCGECSSKKCMAFAISIRGNPDALDECKYMDLETIGKIREKLLQGDWRDDLIKSLAGEVAKLSFPDIAGDLGGQVKNGKLRIRCVGLDYSLGGDGTISPDAGNKWIRILFLHYVRTKGRGEFTGKWIAFSDLRGGFVKTSSFRRDCEEPLRWLMDENLKGVSAILTRLGGHSVSGYPADASWTIDLLPKARSLILYRSGDEDFPSSLTILFDSVIGQFLDVESIVFLCEGLVHTITGMLKESPHVPVQ
jgi:Domain of unknown function (DUF3786)/Putative Fe-S cluster